MSDAPRKVTSPTKDALRLFLRNKPALIAFAMIMALALAAITGAFLSGKKADANELIRMEEAELIGDRYKTEAIKSAVLDPQKSELKDTFLPPFSQSNEHPDKTYWLGTDHLGRDVLARLWSGSSISLTIGFLAVGISVFLGISLGGISGYFGRSRVGLPVFATLLLFLAGGILMAAGQASGAWSCFIVGGALLALQFLIAATGGRWKAICFFGVAALLLGAIIVYNDNIESNTPQGAVYQQARITYDQAHDLLLLVRDQGRRVKEFEDAEKDNLKNIVDQDKPDAKKLPEWLYADQRNLEVSFKLLDLQVARFEAEKYNSANREAQILHESQQERADLLDEYVDAYTERNKEALEDEKVAHAESERLFNANDRDGGRKMAQEASNHAARAATFDPAELKKRIKKLREIGSARQKYIEAVISGIEKPYAARLAAIEKAVEAITKVNDGEAKDPATLRQRQFEIEAALRAWKLAEAEFKLADNKMRREVAEKLVAELTKAKTSDKPEDADLGLADMTAEVAKQTGAKPAVEKSVADAKDDIEKLGKIKAEKDLAGAAKQLPPFRIQGSNDLIDRRGKMRGAYVIKFDTEVKNDRTSLRVAEDLDGYYKFGFYRFTSHFLTATFLYLLLVVAALALMASAQASVMDSKLPFKALYLPTITVDDLVMRFTEIMMTIPVIFLILAILAIFEKDVYITMGVIGLTSWMGTTRFVRAEILSLREQDFVQAARSLGLSDFRIIWRHLVPNAISPVLVSASIGVAGAVLAESTLSFLGIGAKPEQTTWGQILSEGREYIFDAPWLTWIPGIAILITVLSFNLLGEGLREAFNPKLRGR
jgi:ABC-type dipeptide/oligopeptide/nickel transport system permease subunit